MTTTTSVLSTAEPYASSKAAVAAPRSVPEHLHAPGKPLFDQQTTPPQSPRPGPLLCNHHRNSQRRPHIPTEAPPMTAEPLDRYDFLLVHNGGGRQLLLPTRRKAWLTRSGAASASRPSGNRLLPIPPSTGRGLVDSMSGNLGRAVKRSPDRRSQKSLFMRSAQPVTLLSVTHTASPLRH